MADWEPRIQAHETPPPPAPRRTVTVALGVDTRQVRELLTTAVAEARTAALREAYTAIHRHEQSYRAACERIKGRIEARYAATGTGRRYTADREASDRQYARGLAAAGSDIAALLGVNEAELAADLREAAQ